MSDYKYKFSVVIPIYNVEKYLEEAIESVINQTIGFKENIQIILVNDGSTDKSKQICLKYQKMYPNNIKYIFQENKGVSEARNEGIKHIEGEYVSFLDPDDKWDLKTFDIVYRFFEKNKDEIDLVACRMKFFDAKDDYHKLDYKFNKTRIVDIRKYYQDVQLSSASTFTKSCVVKQHQFDKKLKYGEDAKYISEIILEKKKYGVLREAIYYYRKRKDKSSAIQNNDKSIEWYTTTVEYFHKDLMNESIKKCGKVIPYIQYLIMYDLQWRIKRPLPDFLDKNIKKQYIEQIVDILKQIEDYIVCEQKSIYSEIKMYALTLKYDRDIINELEYKKGKLYFNNIAVMKIKENKSICKINILEIENNNLVMEGIINTFLPRENYEMYVQTHKNNLIPLELEKGKKSIYSSSTFALERQVKFPYTFKIKLPLENIKKVKFVFKYKNEYSNTLVLSFGKCAKLSNELPLYYAKEKYIISYSNKKITVTMNIKRNKIRKELKYYKELIKEKSYKVILYRIIYFICKAFNKKEIWLLSDREEKADDNGEHIFKYIVEQRNKNIKPYFVLDKNSKDFKRMKKIGKVIKLNSTKHKIYFLLSKKIISSQASEYVVNAFGKNQQYYKDLYDFKFVFLQHGITKDDLSNWLKKGDKNIRLFVTATKPEYDSIINGDYYYTEKEVKLTGFPRYDELQNNKKKSIIILPTQRRKLAEWDGTHEISYNPYFRESECFKFYNNLIHDERILKVLKEKGYKLRFGLHPLHSEQCVDFEGNEYVEIIQGGLNYQKEFGENALLVTDYSSVAFDFAYLKKPVIYTQFDKDTFYEGQVYDQGYFDYERDGFGPVCYDYETTVNAIMNCIENDCKLEDKYLQRVEKFYYKFDNNNCKRVYEEILKL